MMRLDYVNKLSTLQYLVIPFPNLGSFWMKVFVPWRLIEIAVISFKLLFEYKLLFKMENGRKKCFGFYS